MHKPCLSTYYVSGIFMHYLIQSLEQSYEECIIFISVLLKKKLRHKEINKMPEIIKL